MFCIYFPFFTWSLSHNKNKNSVCTFFSKVDTLKSDKDELEQEVQKLKDKLHQFKKKSVDSEMDIQKTHESITEMEDRTKALEDKLRTSEITCEEWQDKFKESQETIYQNNIQLKKLNAEKSALQTDLDEVCKNFLMEEDTNLLSSIR